MRETAQVEAFYTLISFLTLPAAALLFFGLKSWWRGRQLGHADKERWGRMLTLFGIILMTIVFILAYFLKGTVPG